MRLLTAVPRFTMVTPVGHSLSLLIRSCTFPVAIGVGSIALQRAIPNWYGCLFKAEAGREADAQRMAAAQPEDALSQAGPHCHEGRLQLLSITQRGHCHSCRTALWVPLPHAPLGRLLALETAPPNEDERLQERLSCFLPAAPRALGKLRLN